MPPRCRDRAYERAGKQSNSEPLKGGVALNRLARQKRQLHSMEALRWSWPLLLGGIQGSLQTLVFPRPGRGCAEASPPHPSTVPQCQHGACSAELVADTFKANPPSPARRLARGAMGLGWRMGWPVISGFLPAKLRAVLSHATGCSLSLAEILTLARD